MIKFYLPLVSCVAFLISCNGGEKKTTEVATDTAATVEKKEEPLPAIEQLWSTDTVFKTPESVYYDKERNILYVSNLSGMPFPPAKKGEGFISRLKTDGTIDSLKWVTGLNAPKGMGVYQTKLYVTDIDRVVEIDIEKGKVAKTYPVKNAKFLNDLAVDSAGVVYFTDSEDHKIYTLTNGKVAVWMEGDKLKAPNGLLIKKDSILLASMGSNDVRAISKATKEFTVLADSIGAGDGLVATGKEHNYIVSDWEGRVFWVAPGKHNELLLDTRADKVNAADIAYIADQNLLLVPTFFGHKVVAYKVNR